MNQSASGDHATTDRLSERAHESVDKFAKTAGKGEEQIRQKAAEAEASIRDTGKKAKKRSGEAMESISTFVQDKPLISLGIAFAAGTLLSALLGRRS